CPQEAAGGRQDRRARAGGAANFDRRARRADQGQGQCLSGCRQQRDQKSRLARPDWRDRRRRKGRQAAQGAQRADEGPGARARPAECGE
nr:hypothetical protein [Tanacetum cinerariifolium]